jgi:hypothetical protein
MEFLNNLLALFAGLAGFAAFITLLVNVGKRLKWIPDGAAPMVVKWLNLGGLVVVGILSLVAPNMIPFVDSALGTLAEIGGLLLQLLTFVFAWPLANRISGFTYGGVRKFPLVGYSHSG